MRQGLFFFFLALLFSCSKPSVEIPVGVLKKDQMITVLADVHIALAASVMNQVSDSTRYSMSNMMNYVFIIHQITQAQYDSSLSFYSNHPEIMEEIYDSVITELSKKQGEVAGSTINKPPVQ